MVNKKPEYGPLYCILDIENRPPTQIPQLSTRRELYSPAPTHVNNNLVKFFHSQDRRSLTYFTEGRIAT